MEMVGLMCPFITKMLFIFHEVRRNGMILVIIKKFLKRVLISIKVLLFLFFSDASLIIQ